MHNQNATMFRVVALVHQLRNGAIMKSLSLYNSSRNLELEVLVSMHPQVSKKDFKELATQPPR